ncbi:NAD(P)-dependent oxidoreductase [Sphingomonas sp. MMS24-J13]|uniref:NAD(P)-dependent oxidoreductase n=1 Tax=Sphingomonas sp. MMS24-J13 TaxID=3238686 RepID=UPI00384F331D
MEIDADILLPGDLSNVSRDAIEAVACGETLPDSLIDALPNLKLVACFSTGYAGIDLARLRARGIALTTGAGVNAHDVADHAIALFLALWHGIPAADALVRAGGWREGVVARRSLRGRRAGVVGLGRIGHAVATRLAAHEMEVAWWGPRDQADAGFPRAESLHALAEQSDALFVATRAVPENAGQIDAAILHALGRDGVLINVSRGFLVDEAALVSALTAGTIAGAALDVFEQEPTDPARWRDLPNIVLSPHLAGYTYEAGEDLFGQLRANIERHFRGAPLLTPVTGL